jgi:NADH:ubiquinone oxidoreductase subunit 6 (subunit J)
VLVEEKVLGLGVLKDLLYSSYPLFLIFSTIILLIALIGSALMVKKIK